jgi:hypothetical protein
LIRWAEKVGPETQALVCAILESKPHPEQGFRSCLGILRLGTTFSPERLEHAAQRARAIHALSYRSVHSILKANLDGQPLLAPEHEPRLWHEDIRGAEYYHSPEGDAQ